MFGVLAKLPLYIFFRLFHWPRMLPMNYTFSVSYKCNSRCKTCNVYERESNDLTVEEWKKVFTGLRRSLFWATISGGEPFLRADLKEIVRSLYDICKPSIINIPTNGILSDKIVYDVTAIAAYCKKSQIVINVSIDDIGEKHDLIRGISGNYQKVCETFKRLKGLGASNLSVGIHTVISKYNVKDVSTIYEQLVSLNPDSYITEIAEEREELKTKGMDISPSYDDYVAVVDFLIKKLQCATYTKIGKLTRIFRIEYYKLVKRILLEKRQVRAYSTGLYRISRRIWTRLPEGPLLISENGA